VPEAWVCFYPGFQDASWWSDHDMSRDVPPIECHRVDGVPAGVSGGLWLRAMRALAKAQFPF
jgi:hypothetical protein